MEMLCSFYVTFFSHSSFLSFTPPHSFPPFSFKLLLSLMFLLLHITNLIILLLIILILIIIIVLFFLSCVHNGVDRNKTQIHRSP